MNKFLNSVYGQNKIKETIESLINSKRVPHALLFSGSQGVGKFNTAINFIKMLNYDEGNSKAEHILRKISKLEEPYIKYIFPLPRGSGEKGTDSPLEKLTNSQVDDVKAEIVEKSKNPYRRIYLDKANTIKISSINSIRKFVNNAFDDIKYRAIIIENAHLMNSEAQNSLLKNLEEPPNGVIFILITPNKEKLLQTILSRCWHLNFDVLNNGDISNILINEFQIENELANKVARFCDGSVQSALNLIENDFEKIIESTISILRFSLAEWYNSALTEIDGVIEELPKVKIKILINFILKWLNDVQKHRIDKEGNFYFHNNLETIEKFNEKFSSISLDETFNNLSVYEEYLDKNVSLNIITTNIIFEIASIVKR